MDGLLAGRRIDQNHIDTLVTEGLLQPSGNPTRGGGTILEDLIHLDEEIDVTAPRPVVQPGAEEIHARPGSENPGHLFPDDLPLLVCQSHRRSPVS